jgi:hypothetical protein
MTDDAHWEETLRALGAYLRDLETAAPPPRGSLRKAQEILDQGVREVRQEIRRQEELRSRRVKGPRSPSARVRYRIADSRRGEALSEHRASNSPIRCPRHVYDAVAAALAEAGEPLAFPALASAVESRIKADYREHELRVALRAWVAHDLVEHAQTQFRPKGPRSRFQTAARRLWRQLKEQSTGCST